MQFARMYIRQKTNHADHIKHDILGTKNNFNKDGAKLAFRSK